MSKMAEKNGLGSDRNRQANGKKEKIGVGYRIDKLQEGSTFRLTVLEETMTLRVTEILVTEPQVPQEIYERIKVEEGRELCTLITCTSFGKTTHRLLVCGERME